MSTELVSIYNKLYNDGIEKIQSDQYEMDTLIDSTLDNRRGVALVIRPDKQTRDRIRTFLDILQTIEPDQYYYPSSDMHITVMAIISCYEGFDYKQIVVQDYIDLIRRCLPSEKNLEIHFKGITASPSCIMIQGFPRQSILNELRNNLRTAFQSSSLEQSMDKRYALQTAHVTAVRFRKPFKAKDKFLKVLEDFKDYDFGTATIDEMELIHNDWYVREKFVEKLCPFKV